MLTTTYDIEKYIVDFAIKKCGIENDIPITITNKVEKRSITTIDYCVIITIPHGIFTTEQIKIIESDILYRLPIMVTYEIITTIFPGELLHLTEEEILEIYNNYLYVINDNDFIKIKDYMKEYMTEFYNRYKLLLI